LKLKFGGDKYKDPAKTWPYDEKWITPEPVTLEVGMTEADFSNKNLGVGGAIILSAWISHKDKGALTTLILGGDKYEKGSSWVTPAPATLKFGMTEANFSNKNLGAGGAIIISAWISHKDNGALALLDLSSNMIGGHFKCYHDDGSGLGYGGYTATPEGPKAIVDAIKDMGALTKFDISGNELREEGTSALAEALQGNQIMTELNISSNQMFWNGISGVAALAAVVSGMGALSKLDVRKNNINAKGKSALKKAAGVGVFRSR
jgi:hypothetical protein